MLTSSKRLSSLDNSGLGDSQTSIKVTFTPPKTVGQNGVMKNSTLVSANMNTTIPVIHSTNEYSEKSRYLLRNISILISNAEGDSFVLENCKISVSGQKYIGIQQDMFNVNLKNINLQALAAAVNNGYIYIRVVVDNDNIFAGMIKQISTSRPSASERDLNLNCLMRVTDLLSDIVSPITVNSSMNIWNILSTIDPSMPVQIPEAIRDLKFDKSYTFKGQKKTVIDDIMKVLNRHLDRVNMKDYPWLEYELRQDGTLSLFGPTDHLEVLNVQPFTGLTDAPQVSGTEVTFNSIYKYKLTPGRVVKLDNALFSTSGSDSAFIYAFDENGLYVVTEVAYSFNNYPWEFKVSCRAVPLSKYQNFAIK